MFKYKTSIGLYGLQDICGGDVSGIIDMARLADQKKINQVSVTDHVIMSENTDAYPFGDFLSPPSYPWYEPLTLLATIAGATKDIRLATGVLIAPLRSAPLLAKIAATLDVFSKGRLDLGLGVGWQKEEYEACGLDFTKRHANMHDQVEAMQTLWRDTPASFNSNSINFTNLYSEPKPIQKNGVPLYFGLKPTAANIEFIARNGHGWYPIKNNIDFLAPAIEALREAFIAQGRKAEELVVRALCPPAMNSDGSLNAEQAMKSIESLLKVGATHIEFLPCMYLKSRNEFESFVDTLADLAKG